jgi:hypothetical protein
MLDSWTWDAVLVALPSGFPAPGHSARQKGASASAGSSGVAGGKPLALATSVFVGSRGGGWQARATVAMAGACAARPRALPWRGALGSHSPRFSLQQLLFY